MSVRSLIVLGYKLYTLAVPLSWFFLIMFNWYLEFSCLNCMWQVWEPNLFIHQYEFVLMLIALPGIAHMAWKYIS